MKLYQALAQAFRKEGVTDCFALLGDANMHWAGALSDLGTNFVYTRHEHATVAAALAYARTLDQVGVASVTCGPGLTQIMTILPIAVRARVPMVIFAGEAPFNKPWYNQGIEQEPFVKACGAEYRALHDPKTMIADVQDGFRIARSERRPIVFGVPFDLQQQEIDGQFELAEPQGHVNQANILEPNLTQIAQAADWLSQSQRPIILAGLGAVSAGAKSVCVELAENSGALLATTLPAKGYFHDQEFCLGVAGGFSTERAKEIFSQSDLVIGIGTRLASHTFDGGSLTPKARVIHLDIDPQEYVQGRKAADLLIQSDALAGAVALLKVAPCQVGWRTDTMRTKTQHALDLPDDNRTPDEALHPMAVIKRLADLLPPTCHIINTSGHSAYYSAQMNKHPQDHYTVFREFGAIGNGTSFALGLAAAHPDRPIVLIDGDGSALMHIQELETMHRHNMKILVIVMNDGAYGSEVHKLRADGVTDAGSVFGRPNFNAIARGFGLDAKTVLDLDSLADHATEFLTNGKATVWDIHISDQIASPQILKAHKAAHIHG